MVSKTPNFSIGQSTLNKVARELMLSALRPNLKRLSRLFLPKI